MNVLTGQEALPSGGGGGGPPPPPPPPPGNNVDVGAPLLVANTRLGWTSVHNQQRNTTTKNILATAAVIQNQHLIGFGSATDPQPGAGAAYNWGYMDSTFGYPTASTGYFSGAQERCLTLCGCPPHMRVPKSGHAPDPMGPRSGAQLTSLSDYSPPHSDWFTEYANLAAAAAARYPHIKYFQVWNELKNFYFSTQYSGSNLVPTGSGLPAGAGGGNRWWYEGYTAMFNKIYVAVKAVRPDAMLCGPYAVLRSFSWDPSNDSAYWANDAFPYNFQKPWGYADKKELAVFEYFIKNCSGCDLLTSDIKNLTNDQYSSGYYSGTPGAAPDLANKWLTNPEGGTHSIYYKEGWVDGAWNMGQKQIDLVNWVRALGASSSVYQRSVCDARTIPLCFAEWYAYGQHNQFRSLDPRTGQYWANEPVSSHAEEVAAFAWQYAFSMEGGIYYSMAWKPEGTVQGTENDPGDSNPLALYYQNGSPLSLQPTELKPVCDGLVANFPPGTQLYTVTSSLPTIKGVASATVLMLINRDPLPVSLSADGQTVTLSGYEVRFINRANTNPSGYPMPLSNPANMTRVFQDDFTTYGNIPVGSFPTATGGKWGGYGAGTPDTSGNGQYNMPKTCSVTNGVLNIHLYNEMVGGVQKNYDAAPWPIIPGNQPTGVINGYDYTANPPAVRANIYYGQIEFAFRASTAPGWKTAWLLWPDNGLWPANGEIDYPEGDLSGTDTIHAFMHRQDAATGSDQDARNSGVTYADNTWHKGKVLWTPSACEFWLDDVKIGATITARIPNNPMHWVMQTETRLSGGQPSLGSSGDVQLDWVVMWQLNGVYA